MRNKTVIGHLRFENYHLETTGFMSVVIQFQPKTQTQPSGARSAPQSHRPLITLKLNNHRHEVGGF
jgi:hypothetical protein